MVHSHESHQALCLARTVGGGADTAVAGGTEAGSAALSQIAPQTPRGSAFDSFPGAPGMCANTHMSARWDGEEAVRAEQGGAGCELAPHSVSWGFPLGLARARSRNEKPWEDLLRVVGGPIKVCTGNITKSQTLGISQALSHLIPTRTLHCRSYHYPHYTEEAQRG